MAPNLLDPRDFLQDPTDPCSVEEGARSVDVLLSTPRALNEFTSLLKAGQVLSGTYRPLAGRENSLEELDVLVTLGAEEAYRRGRIDVSALNRLLSDPELLSHAADRVFEEPDSFLAREPDAAEASYDEFATVPMPAAEPTDAPLGAVDLLRSRTADAEHAEDDEITTGDDDVFEIDIRWAGHDMWEKRQLDHDRSAETPLESLPAAAHMPADPNHSFLYRRIAAVRSSGRRELTALLVNLAGQQPQSNAAAINYVADERGFTELAAVLAVDEIRWPALRLGIPTYADATSVIDRSHEIMAAWSLEVGRVARRAWKRRDSHVSQSFLLKIPSLEVGSVTPGQADYALPIDAGSLAVLFSANGELLGFLAWNVNRRDELFERRHSNAGVAYAVRQIQLFEALREYHILPIVVKRFGLGGASTVQGFRFRGGLGRSVRRVLRSVFQTLSRPFLVLEASFEVVSSFAGRESWYGYHACLVAVAAFVARAMMAMLKSLAHDSEIEHGLSRDTVVAGAHTASQSISRPKKKSPRVPIDIEKDAPRARSYSLSSEARNEERLSCDAPTGMTESANSTAAVELVMLASAPT